MSNTLPSRNNFNLIRLLAALQVCIGHTLSHLDIDLNIPLIGYFPGVIIFFTTSGFLIYDSFTRNQDLKRYFNNRFLRIFPALWVCFILTVILLLVFNSITPSDIISSAFLKWMITQITIFQFWTPDVLRNWGIGTPNGSLWTIPVEIQFYIAIPIIILLFKNIKIIYKLTFLLIVSILFNLFLGASINSVDLFIKLLGVSILPYLFYFIIGVIIREYWYFFNVIFVNRFIYWSSTFFLFVYFFNLSPVYFPTDFLGFIVNLLLSFLTISFAYSRPIFEKILHRQDISYGIYIYHMLIVNSFVELGFKKDMKYLFISIILTVLIAFLSWNYIEKRALNRKK
jgi:peptidoglycan/LPS O-acetylase OafA/YrhL